MYAHLNGEQNVEDRANNIIEEAKQLLVEGDKYQAYRRLLMLQELNQGAASAERDDPQGGTGG